MALFGPQHGFRSDLQDNMIETPHAQRRAPACRSTRSTARRASRPPRCCADVDVLVVDLQDVGTRIYTYIYTMANCMRAAARHGVRVVVCDGPNPIGGDEVEGSAARPGVRVVRRPVPDSAAARPDDRRAGEAVQREFGIGVRSMSCRWRAGAATMYLDETGLPWIMPSPNMPTLDSAIVYPGAVLFEGTTCPEGRGTTRPFELIGAPWIDGERFADAMNAPRTARRAFPRRRSSSQRSRSTRARLAAAARSTSPIAAASSQYAPASSSSPSFTARHRRVSPGASRPTSTRSSKEPIDILYGSDLLRRTVDGAGDVSSLISSWSADEERFRKQRERYLLY